MPVDLLGDEAVHRVRLSACEAADVLNHQLNLFEFRLESGIRDRSGLILHNGYAVCTSA